jgi:hypothetical protein
MQRLQASMQLLHRQWSTGTLIEKIGSKLRVVFVRHIRINAFAKRLPSMRNWEFPDLHGWRLVSTASERLGFGPVEMYDRAVRIVRERHPTADDLRRPIM